MPSAARTTVGGEVARFARLASGVVQHRGADARDAAVLGAQRLGDAVAFQHDGARGLGMAGQLLVEAEPGPDQPVLREVGNLRPGQFDRAAAGDQPKALVPPPALGFRMREPQLLDLADRARSQAVAADLLAGKGGFFQHRDVNARLGEVVRGGGSGGSRADDQYFHVVLDA